MNSDNQYPRDTAQNRDKTSKSKGRDQELRNSLTHKDKIKSILWEPLFYSWYRSCRLRTQKQAENRIFELMNGTVIQNFARVCLFINQDHLD